jgi:hypothetical protein
VTPVHRVFWSRPSRSLEHHRSNYRDQSVPPTAVRRLPALVWAYDDRNHPSFAPLTPDLTPGSPFRGDGISQRFDRRSLMEIGQDGRLQRRPRAQVRTCSIGCSDDETRLRSWRRRRRVRPCGVRRYGRSAQRRWRGKRRDRCPSGHRPASSGNWRPITRMLGHGSVASNQAHHACAQQHDERCPHYAPVRCSRHFRTDTSR